MYNWVPLLYPWNEHNIVYQLYSNKIKINEKFSHDLLANPISGDTIRCHGSFGLPIPECSFRMANCHVFSLRIS